MIENENDDGFVGLGQLAERQAELFGPELGARQLERFHEPPVQVRREQRIGQLSQVELEQIGGQVWTLLAHFAQRQIRILRIEFFHFLHLTYHGRDAVDARLFDALRFYDFHAVLEYTRYRALFASIFFS